MRDDSFLTTEELLEYLQVNLRTVYRLIKAGKLPAVRVGRQWRFRKSAIDAWLVTQSVAPVAAGPANVPPATSGERRPRVLVVDDEPSILELLSRGLSSAEYEVDVASNGPLALECVNERVYDLLITDLRMPGMSGLNVIREARNADAKLPVIVITGYSSEANAIDAVNLGVSGYVTKPFKIHRVLEVAAKALNARSAPTAFSPAAR